MILFIISAGVARWVARRELVTMIIELVLKRQFTMAVKFRHFRPVDHMLLAWLKP